MGAAPCSQWVLTPLPPAQSSRRRTAVPVLTTIDLTEEDSRDSSQSSSTLSGSSSQEGQNGSTELVAEEPESRDAGIALEYQVDRGAVLFQHLFPVLGGGTAVGQCPLGAGSRGCAGCALPWG